jgi:hypothetical protein
MRVTRGLTTSLMTGLLEFWIYVHSSRLHFGVVLQSYSISGILISTCFLRIYTLQVLYSLTIHLVSPCQTYCLSTPLSYSRIYSTGSTVLNRLTTVAALSWIIFCFMYLALMVFVASSSSFSSVGSDAPSRLTGPRSARQRAYVRAWSIYQTVFASAIRRVTIEVSIG